MQKLIFSTVLIGSLLLPRGAAFAQNVTIPSLDSRAEPTEPVDYTALITAAHLAPTGDLTRLASPVAAASSLPDNPYNPYSPVPSGLAKPSDPFHGSFRSRLMERTFAFLGVPYKWGGNKVEDGFDCSGFVRQVVADLTGLRLPRTAKEQSEVGSVVARQELKPGDLVFFNTMKRTFSHVGIYLGNNLFAHAPRVGKSVQVSSLTDAYWVKTYQGARRVVTL